MPYRIKKAKGKDGFYVYGEDGKRHSKKPLKLEMAKKQMTALNIAHARKEGAHIAIPTKVRKQKVHIVHHEPAKKADVKKAEAPKPHAIRASKVIEEAVELANMRGKKGIHSPAGIVAPLVSETTGGGSGLANDAHWESSVKKGGRVAMPEKVDHAVSEPSKPDHVEKMSLAEKRKHYAESYKKGVVPKEMEKAHRVGYTKFYKAMKAGTPPKWHKE